ncbi:hypothetical protein Tco_0344196 [Tanacetum coccineum]
MDCKLGQSMRVKFVCYLLQQKEDGIFISQDKYVAEILKKFNYSDVKSASTPIDLEKPLVKDRDTDEVDVHLYRSMIGFYVLSRSRPDILFALQLNAAKLKLMMLGLKLVLPVFVYAVKHMLMLPVQVPAAEVNGVRQLQALVDKKRVIIMESSIMRDLHLDDAEGDLGDHEDDPKQGGKWRVLPNLDKDDDVNFSFDEKMNDNTKLYASYAGENSPTVVLKVGAPTTIEEITLSQN